MSNSSDQSKRVSPEPEKNHSSRLLNKVFVTKMDGRTNEQDLRTQLEKLFGQYGTLDKIVAKNSRDNEYSFAFVEYTKDVDATQAVNKLNGYELGGKKISVQLQDDGRRRKDKDQGCYTCGRFGHFARECRERDYDRRDRDRRDRRRDYSRSRSRRSRSPRQSRRDRRRRSRSHKSKRQRRRYSRSNERRKDKRTARSPSSRS